MKAADFGYKKPNNIANVLELLAGNDGDIQVLAGGQSLMPMMNFRLAQPETLIDLNGVAELNFIAEKEDTITIGAMTRYVELLGSSLIETHIPLFKLALPYIAHAAIRNRGTIGGSVALADPAAEMPALLLALNATICVVSTNGERDIPADDFFKGVYETALAENELIKSITIPKAKPANRFGFYELARRHGDYAMAGVAIAAQFTEPVKDVKIAMFSVSDRARRLHNVEGAFEGGSLDFTKVAETIHAEFEDFDFHGDLNADAATKKHLSRVVLKRALESMAP